VTEDGREEVLVSGRRAASTSVPGGDPAEMADAAEVADIHGPADPAEATESPRDGA
jgi:hypothetical protein